MAEIQGALEKSRLNRRTFLKGLGLAAGAVTLSGPLSLRAFAQGPVTIGALYPMTGTLAEFGPNFVNGGQLAADQLNEAAGRELIRVEVGDTQTDAAPAIAEANRLVDIVGVPAIVGGAASGVTIPVAQSVCIPKQVLQISYASTSPQITTLEDNDYLFRTCPSDALQGVVAGRLALALGYETASTMYVNNPYGQGLSNFFADTFESLGGKVLAQVPHPEAAQPTYVAELQQALEGNPDVVFLPTYPGQAVVFMREAIEQFGYNSWQFTDGTRSLEIPEAVGAENVEGLWGTAPGSWKFPSVDQFRADYEVAFGEKPPLPFIENVYDAVILVGLAIYKAQVDGVEINGTTLRDRLRLVAKDGEVVGAGVDELKKAIEILSQGGDINYEGAAGAQDFDANGDVLTPIDIWRFKNGEPVTVWTIG